MVNRFSIQLAVAFAALLCATSAPAEELVLATDFGPVSLEVEPDGAVHGDYPDYQGRLVGAVTAEGGMEMTWIQPTSEVRCDERRFDSYFWGRVAWSVEGDQLLGGWSYCDAQAGSSGAWNGRIVSGASALAAGAPEAVTDLEMNQAFRYEWGQYADQADASVLTVDVNCDGADDRVIARINQENPDGPFFQVLALARYKGELISDMMTFTMASDDMLSVCSGPDQPAPTVELWEAFESGEVLNMTGYSGLCATPLRVDDGMCDATWLFWSDEPITEGHFVTYRS